MYRNKDLKYIYLLFLGFYSVSLVDFSIGFTYFLKIPELLLILLSILSIPLYRKIDKNTLIHVLLFALPFILTILVRSINFTPIETYEIESLNRISWYNKLVLKESISLSSVTQMMYVILGLISYLLFSHIELDKKLVNKVVIFSLILVNCIGIFQVIMFYIGKYEIYTYLFYNNIEAEYQVLSNQMLLGIKRINSTLPEPSIFGFYNTVTLIFLIQNGAELSKNFLYVTFLIMILSTSVTAIIGVFLVIGILVYRTQFYRKIQFKILALFSLFLVFTIGVYNWDLISILIDLKSGSFNERFEFGVTRTLENLWEMPFFGYSFGAHRSTIMLFNLLGALGIFGFLTFIFIYIGLKKNVRLFVIMILLMGITVPDIQYLFLWTYGGILNNELS